MSPGQEMYEAWAVHVHPGAPLWLTLTTMQRTAWEQAGEVMTGCSSHRDELHDEIEYWRTKAEAVGE